jgi:hypothetical protein
VFFSLLEMSLMCWEPIGVLGILSSSWRLFIKYGLLASESLLTNGVCCPLCSPKPELRNVTPITLKNSNDVLHYEWIVINVNVVIFIYFLVQVSRESFLAVTFLSFGAEPPSGHG